MARSCSLRIASGLLLFLVATAVSQIEDYNGIAEITHEKKELYNFLGHVTFQDLIRSTLREVLSEIEEGPETWRNSLRQCVTEDHIKTLQNMIKSDLENVKDSLKNCVRSDEFKDLQRTVNSGGDCSFYSIESSHPKTPTLVGPGIPPLDMLEDVAFAKHVYASSVLSNSFQKRYGNDGDDVTFYHSLGETNPWWMVDLGGEKTIYHITILPRQNCCPERFHDIELRIGDTLETNGDFSSHRLLAIYKGHYALDQGRLKYTFYTGVKGRYISLKKNTGSKGTLEFCTLQAIAQKT